MPLDSLMEENLTKVFNQDYKDFREYLSQHQITELDLTDKNLGFYDHKLAHLGKALQGTCITAVVLCFNKINAENAIAFIQALRGSQVKKVDLGENRMSAAGMKQLGEAFNETLVENLYFGGNAIGNEGSRDLIAGLKNTAVKVLCLTCNQMDDTGAQNLNEALKDTRLTQLDLRGNFISVLGIEALMNGIPNTCEILSDAAALQVPLIFSTIEKQEGFELPTDSCHQNQYTFSPWRK